MIIQRENLTAANIKYLLAIRELHRNKEAVRSVDVAELLGISRPSVHAMIETMKAMGLLIKEKRGEIRFTDKGNALADTYNHYYKVITPANNSAKTLTLIFITTHTLLFILD